MADIRISRIKTIEQIVQALENNDPTGDEVIWAGQMLRQDIDQGILSPDSIVELWPE